MRVMPIIVRNPQRSRHQRQHHQCPNKSSRNLQCCGHPHRTAHNKVLRSLYQPPKSEHDNADADKNKTELHTSYPSAEFPEQYA